MTTFANQTIGSHDAPNPNFEYVEVWYDETLVQGFTFHSVGARDVMGRYHGVYGVTVEARYVWQAVKAFSNTSAMAVDRDGKTFFATWVLLADRTTEEFRMGDKYGKTLARMRRTGYVQPPRK